MNVSKQISTITAVIILKLKIKERDYEDIIMLII